MVSWSVRWLSRFWRRHWPVLCIINVFERGGLVSRGTFHPLTKQQVTPSGNSVCYHQKKGIAIIWVLQKLQHYLCICSFTVITNHNPLSLVNLVAGGKERLICWNLIFQHYNFTIQHKKNQTGCYDRQSQQNSVTLESLLWLFKEGRWDYGSDLPKLCRKMGGGEYWTWCHHHLLQVSNQNNNI